MKSKSYTSGKQTTLATFGFTKRIETSRGSCFKGDLENFVNELEKKETFVTCPYCLESISKQFTSNQYLNNHIKYKHPRKDTIEIEKNVSKPTLLVLHPKPKASLSVIFPTTEAESQLKHLKDLEDHQRDNHIV